MVPHTLPGGSGRPRRRLGSRATRLLAAASLLLLTVPAMALEKPRYTVVQEQDGLEVREYQPYLVAETEVTGPRDEAGNQGFRRLAGYIFGRNRGEKRIAMTAPVTQEEGTRIDMTAPVLQQARSGAGTAPPTPEPGGETGPQPAWVIQFMMPSPYTLETLPEPLDPAVRFRQVPARRFAALRYSGGWSESRYQEKLAELRAAMQRAGLTGIGEPVWARYDPPFMPWFLRTNEILIELAP